MSLFSLVVFYFRQMCLVPIGFGVVDVPFSMSDSFCHSMNNPWASIPISAEGRANPLRCPGKKWVSMVKWSDIAKDLIMWFKQICFRCFQNSYVFKINNQVQTGWFWGAPWLSRNPHIPKSPCFIIRFITSWPHIFIYFICCPRMWRIQWTLLSKETIPIYPFQFLRISFFMRIMSPSIPV